MPTFTSCGRGSRTTSALIRRGFCLTPLTVRREYVTRRRPASPARSTTSVPWNRVGSSLLRTWKGIGSSRTSLPPVIRSTVTVCPSRGKLPCGTDVVSWPRRVIPASSTASRTVAALVRTVRARPSAMIVIVRSVRTSSASPSRPICREREVDR